MAYLRWSSPWPVAPLEGECKCPYYLYYSSRCDPAYKGKQRQRRAQIIGVHVLPRNGGEPVEMSFTYPEVKNDRGGVLKKMGILPIEAKPLNKHFDAFIQDVEEGYPR